MLVLKLRNDFSYLLTPDVELKSKLNNVLRFRQKNYHFSKLYKQGVWDGYINFFGKDSGKFLTGLLPEVQFALSKFNQPYQVVDERTTVDFRHHDVKDDYLNQFLSPGQKPVTLHDYQVDLINKIIKNKRGIVKAPTSAGKTNILIGAMKALPPGLPILILGNRKSVVRQNYKELIKWGFKNVGLFDGSTHEANVITCATVQSIEHLEKLMPKFRALFVDEVHMMTSAQSIAAYKKLEECFIRIAISATPFKFGETDYVQKYTVKGYFGPILKVEDVEFGVLTTKLLQEQGKLSKSLCTFYPIDEPQIPYDIYLDAVTNGIAQNWHFHQTVARLVKGLKGRTLILVERLTHGDALHSLIPGSLWVQGKDDDETRDFVIKELQESEGRVAIATQQIFNAAINVFVHNLINCAGGKAEHDIIQRMGRGLRLADDKDGLNYYDFIFSINPYLEKHSKSRIKILKKEGHQIIIKDKIDF